MHYGAQYYPEHWPEERWKTDAEMMRRAGFTAVRMGEFAWSAYEPSEGKVDFSWMERAIDLLGEHGVKTILCTCSRTPPQWAYRNHPGILNARKDGTPWNTDGRYHIGLLHPEFVEISGRIDGELIRHFAGNENVVAWQIDNEIGAGNDCHCGVCRDEFRAYLEKKYKTPEALNEAWGPHFWSFAPTDFAEVPAACEQPQLELEYRRFLSKANVDFAAWRSRLMHEVDPGKPVTTNFQNIRAFRADRHAMAQVIDVGAMNHYPSRTPELAIDLYRAQRGEVWALEQHSRLQSVDTPLGWTRLWAWMAVAHGASGVTFFRWRQCRWGREQYADGLLPHSGEENRFYADAAKMGGELKQIGDLIDSAAPRSEVAVAYSYESRWAVAAGLFPKEIGPVEEAIGYHKSLARNVASIDAIDPREHLSRYKLVIAPRLWIVDDAIADNMRSFVEGGGVLCLTAGSGVADTCGKSFDTPRPGPLAELAGVKVSDLAFEGGMRLKIAGDTVGLPDGATGREIADELHLDGAEAVASFTDGWREGRPAITSNAIGRGRVVYVSTILDGASRDILVKWLCGIAGTTPRIETPPGVSVYEQRSEEKRLMFLINWSEDTHSIELPPQWTDAFSGDTCGRVDVAAGDLRILVAPAE